MPQLTDPVKERITLLLGWESYPNAATFLGVLNKDFSQAAIDRIDAILAQITTYETSIEESTSQLEAEKVDVLSLNFKGKVKGIRAAGNRLLKELSNITAVAILYNKFTGETSDTAFLGEMYIYSI